MSRRSRGATARRKLTYAEFIERADDRAIRTGFEAAKKAFGADIAQSYVNHLAGPDDRTPTTTDCAKRTFARRHLHRSRRCATRSTLEALELTERLFAQHRVAIKALPDVRQQEYEDIRAMATEPQRGALRRPRTRIEGFSAVEEDGEIVAAPLAPLAPDVGRGRPIPADVAQQLGARGRAAQSSRGRMFAAGTETRRAPPSTHSASPTVMTALAIGAQCTPTSCSSTRSSGKIVASIIDPHGHHLDDALMKMKALAAFAGTYGDAFHRIEALAEVDGRMRVIDMKADGAREGGRCSRGESRIRLSI